MADKDLTQHQQLAASDRTRYVNVLSDIYALLQAAEITIGGDVLSGLNPLPVDLVNPETGDPLPVDDVTGNLRIIDTVHSEIHEAEHYFVEDYDGDVDATDKYWLIKAPNTAVRAHIVFTFAASLNGTAYVYENPTVSNNGTPLTEINNDRNSANTATVSVFRDPTVSNDGTQLKVVVIGSDSVNPSGSRAIGGAGSRDEELILEQNEDYLVKFTAITNNTRVSVGMYWYEEGS